MYTPKIEQAIKTAAILHKDHVRKGATPIPYITHLYSVATMVSDHTKDEDTIVAALLHDTIEDTNYTPEELEEAFGTKVKNIVLSLSEPQSTEDRRYTWHEQKATYAELLKNAPIEALLISAADKIHNMNTIVEQYQNDHERFINEFGGALDDRIFMYQLISDTLNEKLDNPILSEFNAAFNRYKNFVEDVKKTAIKNHTV